MIYCGRSLVMWVLRLVAVDVVILTLWMVVDGPHTAMTLEVYGYAGEPAPPPPPLHRFLFLAAKTMEAILSWK